MTNEDIIDYLSVAEERLYRLSKEFPAIIGNPELESARRHITKVLNSCIEIQHRFMSAKEIREFNDNLDSLKNGAF